MKRWELFALAAVVVRQLRPYSRRRHLVTSAMALFHVKRVQWTCQQDRVGPTRLAVLLAPPARSCAMPSRLARADRAQPFLQGGCMAKGSHMHIRVYSARGSSSIQYSTGGRYVSLTTNQISSILRSQPILTTASQHQFWAAVLAIVTADMATKPQ